MEESTEHIYELNSKKNPISEKERLIISIIFPLFFLLICWSIKIIEISIDRQFYFLGIYPLKFKGLIGIITSPLIHENINHLVNNSIPLFLFSVATFYFYRPLGFKVFFLIWLMTGIWVWFIGRSAYHIGASGIVYGLAFFLFFSGAIRKNTSLAAISLIVVFLYGSMIWGIFPFIPDVSWEAHLSGGIAGLILAILFKDEGPQRQKYEWENEMDEDDINEMLDEMLKKNSKLKNKE